MSACELRHSPIIDASTATIVCQDCARVLEEGLSYNEVKQQDFCTIPKEVPSEAKEIINGENVHDLLVKIADKLHLCQSSIDNSYLEYKKNKKNLKDILKIPGKYSNKKRLLLSCENILIYSIYTALKKNSCPRSIKEICNIAGGLKPLNILHIGSFLEKSRDRKIPPQRLRPITAKDIILTHYPYIEGLSFEDVTQIFHRLNLIGLVSFTPSTTAAGSIYLYTNFVKYNKQTLQQVSSLFQVTL